MGVFYGSPPRTFLDNCTALLVHETDTYIIEGEGHLYQPMIKTYYLLTKPGIIKGNAITAIAGFVLASQGNTDFGLLLVTLVGLSLVIASAAAFNNYIDRDIDKKMKRTKNRALVTGSISGRDAVLFASVLGLLGTATLAIFTNFLTLAIALTGFFVYVVLYGFWKRRSVYGTIIGSISGAVPPIVGYTAASGRLDAGAIILFFILVLWQMPHFFAIAIYRLKDYAAASIPVLPVKKGILNAKVNMMLYIIAFSVTASLLTVFGYAGYLYLIVVLLLSAAWLFQSLKGFYASDDVIWARQMFVISLIVITVLSLVLCIDVTLFR